MAAKSENRSSETLILFFDKKENRSLRVFEDERDVRVESRLTKLKIRLSLGSM